MLKVILPGIAHVVVDEFPVSRQRLAGERGTQRRQRHLPVERRVDAAYRAEARELLADDVLLLRPCGHVAVGRRVVRDRGVDVEAIDRRLWVCLPGLARQLAVGGDGGGGHIGSAGVLATGAAEPRLRLAVIVLTHSRGRRGLSLRLRPARLAGRSRRDERQGNRQMSKHSPPFGRGRDGRGGRPPAYATLLRAITSR